MLLFLGVTALTKELLVGHANCWNSGAPAAVLISTSSISEAWTTICSRRRTNGWITTDLEQESYHDAGLELHPLCVHVNQEGHRRLSKVSYPDVWNCSIGFDLGGEHIVLDIRTCIFALVSAMTIRSILCDPVICSLGETCSYLAARRFQCDPYPGSDEL